MSVLTAPLGRFSPILIERIASRAGDLIDSARDKAHDAVAPKRKSHRTGKIVGAVAGGVAAVAVGAAAAYLIKERTQEEPDYNTLAEDGDFALRHYGRFNTAEVLRTGTFTDAMNAGFQPLFDYIAAKPNARAHAANGEKIEMTVPVMVAPESGDSGRWFVRFLMPKRFAIDELPEPQQQVDLGEQDGRRLAVITFSGKLTDRELVQRKLADLREWIAGRGLSETGPAEYAAYNAPIVPGFLRRNEIWLPVSEG